MSLYSVSVYICYKKTRIAYTHTALHTVKYTIYSIVLITSVYSVLVICSMLLLIYYIQRSTVQCSILHIHVPVWSRSGPRPRHTHDCLSTARSYMHMRYDIQYVWYSVYCTTYFHVWYNRMHTTYHALYNPQVRLLLILDIQLLLYNHVTI